MKSKVLLTIGLAMLLAAGAQANQEQLAKSIGEARVETQKTADQLKATLASLTALTKQTKGDLRPVFDTFTSEITNTDAAAAGTAVRVNWMANDGRVYFKNWQATIDGIANASLKKKAQKRLDAVQSSYGKIEAELKTATDKFKPFLSDLKDIQKALASDITPGGVSAAKSVVSSANWNYKYVSKAIDAALKEMDKMQKSLSSEAK